MAKPRLWTITSGARLKIKRQKDLYGLIYFWMVNAFTIANGKTAKEPNGLMHRTKKLRLYDTVKEIKKTNTITNNFYSLIKCDCKYR